MITYIRNSPMPTCKKCGKTMDYWDLRDDESTYVHDDCNNIKGTLTYVPPKASGVWRNKNLNR